jgi:hypothetical protein
MPDLEVPSTPTPATDDLLAQNAPPPSPFNQQQATPPAPAKPKFVSDGKQWVEQVADGSGREPKTEPFSAQDYVSQLPEDLQPLGMKLLNNQIPYPTQQLSREAMAEQKSGRPGPWTTVIKAISNDPKYAAYDFDAARKTVMDFNDNSPTKPGGNLTSINTAIGHVQNYKNSVHALGNYNIPLFGGLVNAGINAAEENSDPRVKKVDMAQDALAAELTKAFRQSTGTGGEVESWKKNLSRNAGEKVQQGSADQAVELLSSRIRNLRQAYVDGVHRDPPFKFIRPDSRLILKRMGYDPDVVESGEYMAPGGIGTPPAKAPQNDMVSAQIPGQPAGQIHRGQRDQFLKDHPGATAGQ